MDGTGQWKGNQSHSRLQMMEEVATRRPAGRETRTHAWRENMTENLFFWWTIGHVLHNKCSFFFLYQHSKLKMSPWTFTLHKHVMISCWNLRPRHWSPPCLWLIAIRPTGEDTRDGLITHFPHVSINNPTDAIVHVVASINTFKRKAVQLWGHAK